MSDWPEASVVHVEADGPWNLRATALRMGGESCWTIFVTLGDSDLWLAVIDAMTVQPLHFDEGSAAFFAKASLLLGEEWDEVWDDTVEVRDFQREALDDLGANMRRRIENSSLEDIANWRAEMETVGEGELLRAGLTGEDPLALRN